MKLISQIPSNGGVPEDNGVSVAEEVVGEANYTVAGSDDTEEVCGAGVEGALKVEEGGEIGVVGAEGVELLVPRGEARERVAAEEEEGGFGSGGSEVGGGEIGGAEEREP